MKRRWIRRWIRRGKGQQKEQDQVNVDRRVVDAITGTDMEALDMERRQKVVKNVLK